MMRYIIIATVFLFQIGNIMCTETTRFMKEGEVNVTEGSFMATIYRIYPQTMHFVCVGVVIDVYFILTAATCFNGFVEDAKVEVYINAVYRGEGEIHEVDGITFDPTTSGQNKNIALVRLAEPVSITLVCKMPIKDWVKHRDIIDVMGYVMQTMANGHIYYKLMSIRIDILHDYPVEDLPKYSFAANNTRSNRSILGIGDVGSPAFINGHFIGLLIWARDTPSAIFINIAKLKYFIVENM